MQNILSDRKTLKNHKFKTWDWEASIRHNKKPTEGKNVRLEERNGTIEKKDKRSGKKQEICCQNIRKFSNQSEEVIFFEERISLKCCEEPNPSKIWLERINKRVIQLDTELIQFVLNTGESSLVQKRLPYDLTWNRHEME